MKNIIILVSLIILPTQFYLKAEYRNSNKNIISFVDSLANLLCPEIQEELRKESFEEFVKLKIDTTKYDKECLDGYHKFYNYFYSLNSLEEKYLEYYNILGTAGTGADLPFLMDKINLKAIYSILQGEKINISKWYKIQIYYSKIIDQENDSLSSLDTLFGVYIPEDIDDTYEICLKLLSKKDIERIMNYKNDDECFWNEIVLSGKTVRREFLLFLCPRLTRYFEEKIKTGNPFVISGLIILNLKNKLRNENFDFSKFYLTIKDFVIPSNVKPIKGIKVLNMDDRE